MSLSISFGSSFVVTLDCLEFLFRTMGFKGDKIKAWCEEIKITKNVTVVAHPQANGQVEVLNRVLVDSLKKRLEQEKTNWVDELPLVFCDY